MVLYPLLGRVVRFHQHWVDTFATPVREVDFSGRLKLGLGIELGLAIGLGIRIGLRKVSIRVRAVSYTHLTLPTILRV